MATYQLSDNQFPKLLIFRVYLDKAVFKLKLKNLTPEKQFNFFPS